MPVIEVYVSGGISDPRNGQTKTVEVSRVPVVGEGFAFRYVDMRGGAYRESFVTETQVYTVKEVVHIANEGPGVPQQQVHARIKLSGWWEPSG